MANINVTVVSAESQVFSGEASFVVVPGESGELGILPGHAPFISKIKPGLVVITHAGDEKRQEELFVAGGLIEVQPDQVSILADTVLRCDELDFERASAAKQKAEEQLIIATDAQEIALVEAELAMLTAQLVTLRKIRRK